MGSRSFKLGKAQKFFNLFLKSTFKVFRAALTNVFSNFKILKFW